jgi:uncharacterized protein YecE (DUF72 family)
MQRRTDLATPRRLRQLDDPQGARGTFPEEGSHLARYAQRFPAVEVNSCFYRSHRPSTYARWATETPADFAFSLKVPKEVTHRHRLVKTGELLGRFLDETAALGAKRGPLLMQLPPSLAFDAKIVGELFTGLRRQYDGDVACEPRHKCWFSPEPEMLFVEFAVARVAADPSVVHQAAEPGGWNGLVYFRLHGSPDMYYSAYPAERLQDVAKSLVNAVATSKTWCIFDNTALRAATTDALTVRDRLMFWSTTQASGNKLVAPSIKEPAHSLAIGRKEGP